MLYAFKHNGLRWFPCNSSGTPIATDFLQLPYELQTVLGNVHEECVKQPIDFFDESRVQFWAEVMPIVRVYSASDILLETINTSSVRQIDGIGVWNGFIDWSVITGLNNGSYCIVQSDTNYLKTEPLEHSDELIKLIYNNNAPHRIYGVYDACFQQIAYIPAIIHNFIKLNKREIYEDGIGRFLDLKKEKRTGCTLDAFFAPFYLHEIISYALDSDIVLIQQKQEGFYLESEFKLADNEEYEINDDDRFSLVEARAKLIRTDSFVRRLPFDNLLSLNTELELLPETNLTVSSFTANWTGNASSYEIQLSDTSDFSNILQSYNLTGFSQSFSGLTACEKYYYRIRGVTCDGVSEWITNRNFKQESFHFQGLYNRESIVFTERIQNFSVKNIHNWASNVILKFAPVDFPSDWSLYPNMTEAQIQEQIDNLTDFEVASGYSIYFEITGYTQIHIHCSLLASYNTESFYLTVGCTRYYFPEFSQFVLIGMDGNSKYNIDSLVSGNGVTSIYSYNLLPSPASVPISAPLNLAELNSAINAHSGDAVILINARYQNANDHDNTIVNISYQ
ncbi:hypothetical protein V9L05_20620 [Bernardetia sp. Wsw4-3y2]|uniref:hypothetical protein n=1 Tax=Bernardetia sp. Wsw4-3y2 TaxID=3127471 RepID=UPI0030CFA022